MSKIFPLQTYRSFRTISYRLFKAGDSIPMGIKGLHESSPGNKIDLGLEVSNGKYIIVGVPAAFSPACSSSHIPGYIKYINQLKSKGVSQVIVTCVNDSFVTKAWSKDLGCPKDVRIIADTQGEFSKLGGYLFDSKNIFGNDRSVRFALIVENGRIVKEFVEPDKIGVNISSAEMILNEL